jgi:hypothetical protein
LCLEVIVGIRRKGLGKSFDIIFRIMCDIKWIKGSSVLGALIVWLPLWVQVRLDLSFYVKLGAFGTRKSLVSDW